MEKNIEQLLSYLVVEVARKFKIDIEEAMEAVALSPLINNITDGNIDDEFLKEDIRDKLFEEIINGE